MEICEACQQKTVRRMVSPTRCAGHRSRVECDPIFNVIHHAKCTQKFHEEIDQPELAHCEFPIQTADSRLMGGSRKIDSFALTTLSHVEWQQKP